MSYKLFLDDERNPQTEGPWVIVRSYDEFVKMIDERGCPSHISFDHDLSDSHYQEYFKAKEENRPFDYNNITEKTGMECTKWLVEKDMDSNGNFIPEDFIFNVHSANPNGAENIRSYLGSYLDFRKKNSPLS